MYDRGTFRQVSTPLLSSCRRVGSSLTRDTLSPKLIHNHSPVAPQDWSAIDLPTEDEIPHLEMQVVNYHRPIVGTFHSKFLVIDREVGLLNSNNIQGQYNGSSRHLVQVRG